MIPDPQPVAESVGTSAEFELASMAEDKKPVEETQPSDREEGELSPQKENEPDFSKKHPLEHRWTLWFDNPSVKQSVAKFGQGLRAVYSFDTVEDFWW